MISKNWYILTNIEYEIIIINLFKFIKIKFSEILINFENSDTFRYF